MESEETEEGRGLKRVWAAVKREDGERENEIQKGEQGRGRKWLQRRVEFRTKFMKIQGIEVERGHAKVIEGGKGW